MTAKKLKRRAAVPCELSFEYKGIWKELDQLLRKQAKRLGGKEIGSSYNTVDSKRGIQFRFPDLASRHGFLESLRTIRSIHAVLL
jgi:hypothetical protein